MTQEEKELLLKDLCARVSYGVKVSLQFDGDELIGTLDAVYPSENRVIVDNLDKVITAINVRCGGFILNENNVKPYLRPLSSITKEERKEMGKIIGSNPIEPFGTLTDTCDNLVRSCAYGSYLMLQYLYSHHFDVVNLIEKGLAREAPKDMYK